MNSDDLDADMTIASGAEGALLANRYRVVRQLGVGGMGSVWLAEDTLLDNKPFAIKMLPSILVSNKRAYRQLKDEALVAMRLVHPNIVQLRAFEENWGNPFLVMDYIDGETLDDYLADYDSRVERAERADGGGGLPEAEVVRILKPIAAALDYAHGEGVVHRDIKPANVMIRKDGRPFILDFGIAREIQETMTRVTGKLSSGTLLYMSPEQLNGAAPRPAQDVYSFAAMAYECLKGEPPFSRGQIEYQILNNPPLDVSADGTVLAESIMAGLSKTPEGRPPSCAEVLEWSALVRKREEAERIKREKAEREAAALRERSEREASERAASNGRRQEIPISEPYTNVLSSFLEKNAGSLFWGMLAAAIVIVTIGVAAKSRENAGLAYTGCAETTQRPRQQPPVQPPAPSAPLGEEAEQHDASEELKEIFETGNLEMGKPDPIDVEDVEIPSGAKNNSQVVSEDALLERAKKDDSQAQYELAMRLYNGDGMEKDHLASAYWAEKAATNGNASAAFLAGLLYYGGMGVAQDYKRAKEYFMQAYNGGNFEACYNLGVMYESGFGCLVDYDEAAKWYTIGDNNDIAGASNNLGLMCLNGKGVPNDGDRALRLFSKAMEKGSWTAAFNIGCMHMDGTGVPRDYAEARRYFNIVIEKSNDFNGIVKLAQERIADMDRRNLPLSRLKPVVRLAVFRRTASGAYEQCDTATVIGDEPGLRFCRDSKRTHFLVLSSDNVSTLLGASGAIVSGSMFNTFKITALPRFVKKIIGDFGQSTSPGLIAI